MSKQQKINSTNNKVGVITEQGFAAGFGLGFRPLSEKDANIIENESDKVKKEQTDSKIKK